MTILTEAERKALKRTAYDNMQEAAELADQARRSALQAASSANHKQARNFAQHARTHALAAASSAARADDASRELNGTPDQVYGRQSALDAEREAGRAAVAAARASNHATRLQAALSKEP